MVEHVLRCFTKKAVARLPEDLIPEDVDLSRLVGTEVRGAPGMRVLEAWRGQEGVYVALEMTLYGDESAEEGGVLGVSFGPVSDPAGDGHDHPVVTPGPDAGEKLSLYWA